mgnify:CR=1 FL=1|tara:strand:- start:207 stop:803 length:597 start_codon:yes stop_codon:yes gene_type:complete
MEESKSKNNYEDVLLRLSMPGKTLRDETIRRMQEKAKETPASDSSFDSESNQETYQQTESTLQQETPENNYSQEVPQQVEEQSTQNNYQEQSTSDQIAHPQQVEVRTQEQPQEVPQQVEEQSTQEQTEQEEILQRLTMPKKEILGAEPERDESEDTRDNPYIYKYGHPHLGSNFNMDTIKNLTNNILDGTKYSKKQKK